jgi:hypothetical protein
MLSAEEFMFVLLAGGLTNCHRRLVSCSHWPHLHRRQEGFFTVLFCQGFID